MECVLPEQFWYDALEKYFGNQNRSKNLDAKKFGCSDSTIKIQRNVSHISGNTLGRFDSKRPWDNLTNDKVPKKQRSKI